MIQHKSCHIIIHILSFLDAHTIYCQDIIYLYSVIFFQIIFTALLTLGVPVLPYIQMRYVYLQVHLLFSRSVCPDSPIIQNIFLQNLSDILQLRFHL